MHEHNEKNINKIKIILDPSLMSKYLTSVADFLKQIERDSPYHLELMN